MCVSTTWRLDLLPSQSGHRSCAYLTGRNNKLALSGPTFVIWALSTTLAVLVVALRYFSAETPVQTLLVSERLFEALFVSFALLWAGTGFRGI